MDKLRFMAPVIPFESFVVSEGKGDYIFDKAGKRVLDLNSGQFCTVLGHSNDELAAVVSRMATVAQHSCASMLSEPVLTAAEKLNAISGPFDARTLLLSTGSEAVETCLRFAKRISGKSGLICFNNGYHGLSLGSQSITYSGVYTFPQVNGIFPITAPNEGDDEAERESLAELERILEAHADEIGVAVFEPIVSVGGLIYPSAAYFASVKDLLDKHDVFLAFDESQTGFGRLGAWFAYLEMEVIPDFVICSKAIGLGYPVAALLFKGSLVDDCKPFPITHYSSHQNDAFGGAIVSFGLDYISEHGMLGSNAEKGELFLGKLKELEKDCRHFARARGRGLMLGLDISIQGVSNYRPIYRDLQETMIEKGVFIQGTDGGRVLRFLPSYIITEEEMDFACEQLRQAHDELLER